MKICNNCNNQNHDDNNFCIFCGKPLEQKETKDLAEIKYCTYCGHENEKDNLFCVKCGHNIVVKKIEKKQEEPVEIQNEVIEKKEDNSLARLSSILGIISLCAIFAPIGIPFSIVIALFGMVTGIVAIIRKPQIHRKKAIRGIILSFIALTLSVVILIIAGPVIDSLKEFLENSCFFNPDSDDCTLGKLEP